MATKQRVNLSLNSDIYVATREILSRVPGKPSVSSLIDELLGEFVVSFPPMLDGLIAAEPGDRVRAVKQFHGNMSTKISLDFADLVRTLEEQGGSTT